MRVLGEVLPVLKLFLEARPGGGCLADGLDGHLLASGLIFGEPGGSIGAFPGRLDEGVALVQASDLIVGGICHCLLLILG